MKRLIKQTYPPDEIHIIKRNDNRNESRNSFSITDVVGMLSQLDELKNFNVAAKNDDEGRLLLRVGDSVYEVSKQLKRRYPRRHLRKLEA